MAAMPRSPKPPRPDRPPNLQRRGLLLAGATAGFAAPALAAQAPHGTQTILDFGAAGDGTTDDSAAFSKALQYAAAEGRVITVPSLTYAIHQPITFTSSAHVGRTWGFACHGAILRSRISNGGDVMSLTSQHIVRYFRLTGGMSIIGSGSDGNGLKLFAAGNKPALYNAFVEGLTVEKVGGSGLLAAGNVFENTFVNCYFQDCKKNGATFAHTQGGVCSAIGIIGCYFNQNGNYGLAAMNLDGPQGGTTDVRVHGGYCRDNQSYGFFYSNGTSAGGAIEQVGFENNCRGLQPGDAKGAHIFAQTQVQLRNCTGYNEIGGATYLLRGYFSGLAILDGCAQGSGGKVKATGASRLVQVNGNGSGHVLLRNCVGGVDLAPGAACTWAAEFSTGPSPRGVLNPRGMISSS
jgi:hypothetical protein